MSQQPNRPLAQGNILPSRFYSNIGLVLGSLLLASCGGSSGAGAGAGTDNSLTTDDSSVVTTGSAQDPETDSAGQVTWPFAPIASSVELEVMAFVEMPLADSGRPARWNDMEYTGERLFVSNEQDGRIYEITGREVKFWFDIADATQSSTGLAVNIDNPWHGGVRGFAFHPDFNSNGKLYVSMLQDRPANPADYTYLSDDSGVGADSVLVEWSVNPGTFVVDTNSYRELFRVGIPEYDHPIKQIAFNPYAQTGQEDYGLLYVAHGDGSAEGSAVAGGEGNDALGKILRINPLQSGTNSYSVPISNPFVGNASLPDEVYSLGHRNPHHLAFLPDGSLIATEAGHDNIEEVNLVEKGGNYGWSEREGAFVHLNSGALANGVTALPSDDAINGFIYPVAQVGHTGALGANFVGQSLGGGFSSDNGSELDGEFFYIDFVNSGNIYHSSVNSILGSQTDGEPNDLTMAQTYQASVLFDHDGNASTEASSITMLELLQSTGSYDGSGRVDVRIGQGPLGEMYLLNKRNNVVYLVRNSYPAGRAIPAVPEQPEVPATTRVNFDITVPAYQSNELQIRVVWGDKDLTAGWVVDESWATSDDFPTDAENRLEVFFNDRNGDITLGSYEAIFRTGINDSETIQITAAQFESMQWDDDNDTVNNLDELIAGTDPLVSDLVVAPTFSMIERDVFGPGCDGCHDSTPRADLDLTAGNAYGNLLQQFSWRQEGAVLVIPFDPDNSYLLQKMENAPGISGNSMSAGTTGNQMVRDWIAAGALDN